MLGLDCPEWLECEEEGVGLGVADANAAAVAVDDISIPVSCDCPRGDCIGENKSRGGESLGFSCNSDGGIWREDRFDDGSRECVSAGVTEVGFVLEVKEDTDAVDTDGSSPTRGGRGGGSELELPLGWLPCDGAGLCGGGGTRS